MIKLKCVTAIGVLALAFAGTTTMALAFKGQEYAKEATVTIAQARAIALKAVPGKITDEELEKERGGSGLRYSFDIKTDSATREVGVDAETGKLLENSVEGPDSD
jgi:uncharacterized membrane protein YkoI